mmetsp:Transcript_12781/g.30076  ORF Transcript_12781/g.30076 Transcript_12781/m.30076 type:complete len:413 (-) Transcript_12781:221-1459(-)
MHKTKLLACLVAWLWVPGQALNLRLKSTGLLGRVAALNRNRAKGASSLSQSLQSGSGPSSKLSKSRKARAARAASIRKQLQMPDAYSLDTEQTMPLARNVMSCYCLAEEYDTEALVEAFKSRAIIIGDVAVVGSGYSPRDDGTLVDLEEFMDKPVAFFFPYGGAVLWGFTETEATSLLVDVETFATNMLTEDEAEVDRMIFGSAEAPPPAASGLIPGGPASGLGPLFSPNFGQETPTSISFARTGASFILRPDARDPLAKLSVSYAFAQSARLGALEAQVEALVEDVRPIPEALAATGKCEALGEKDVAQLTGRSFLISSAVNLYSDILQVPDFFLGERAIPAAVHARVGLSGPRRPHVDLELAPERGRLAARQPGRPASQRPLLQTGGDHHLAHRNRSCSRDWRGNVPRST